MLPADNHLRVVVNLSMDGFVCFFLMLNYLTDDAEHYTFGGYHKKHLFYSRAITKPKIIQSEKS